MGYNIAEESDETLMLLFKDGDEGAFNEIIRRYKTKLYNYIYKYVRDRERSEEIAQEVFIRIYRSRARYQIKAKFSTYVYKIALNLAYNEVRNLNRRKTDLHNNFDEGMFRDEGLKEQNTPENIYARREIENKVSKEINNLSEKYRDVILLCDIEELSYKEAAKILNISIGTVQSRLSRGRLRLKRRLSSFYKA